mmetsp:Transcript_15890/g.29105  ORF Transcript_15890/g.29105 Transcript_15890/m.29105 type:complete len:146 (+) Transcript_15890:476-913(+)|eukprot:CAMPEP_0204911038 /NCGR_PEP_ID=MMETSP1397-20131031/9457_1 /ASSEMBLY_ACC=CAM_ASM_000891 /TAXON_ID=49980 /ORGANISM="Climacostomum Climacostomum virens, Strain Stock W-24" /LENGTH=145 /DNA_ID=CAMNT_0052081435 /DNA_START=404 /DNA_END=844 /DNA_ORIENTATION=-
MKRTKENWMTPQPADRDGISGLRIFDGEDLYSADRTKALKETQKAWIIQQIAEKEEQKRREDEEERQYAHQTHQINRMRGLLEDDLRRKQRMMQASTKEVNLQLSQEKRDKERMEREMKLKEEQEDLDRQARIRQVTPFANPLLG